MVFCCCQGQPPRETNEVSFEASSPKSGPISQSLSKTEQHLYVFSASKSSALVDAAQDPPTQDDCKHSRADAVLSVTSSSSVEISPPIAHPLNSLNINSSSKATTIHDQSSPPAKTISLPSNLTVQLSQIEVVAKSIAPSSSSCQSAPTSQEPPIPASSLPSSLIVSARQVIHNRGGKSDKLAARARALSNTHSSSASAISLSTTQRALSESSLHTSASSLSSSTVSAPARTTRSAAAIVTAPERNFVPYELQLSVNMRALSKPNKTTSLASSSSAVMNTNLVAEQLRMSSPDRSRSADATRSNRTHHRDDDEDAGTPALMPGLFEKRILSSKFDRHFVPSSSPRSRNDSGFDVVTARNNIVFNSMNAASLPEPSPRFAFASFPSSSLPPSVGAETTSDISLSSVLDLDTLVAAGKLSGPHRSMADLMAPMMSSTATARPSRQQSLTRRFRHQQQRPQQQQQQRSRSFVDIHQSHYLETDGVQTYSGLSPRAPRGYERPIPLSIEEAPISDIRASAPAASHALMRSFSNGIFERGNVTQRQNQEQQYQSDDHDRSNLQTEHPKFSHAGVAAPSTARVYSNNTKSSNINSASSSASTWRQLARASSLSKSQSRSNLHVHISEDESTSSSKQSTPRTAAPSLPVHVTPDPAPYAILNANRRRGRSQQDNDPLSGNRLPRNESMSQMVISDTVTPLMRSKSMPRLRDESNLGNSSSSPTSASNSSSSTASRQSASDTSHVTSLATECPSSISKSSSKLFKSSIPTHAPVAPFLPSSSSSALVNSTAPKVAAASRLFVESKATSRRPPVTTPSANRTESNTIVNINDDKLPR